MNKHGGDFTGVRARICGLADNLAIRRPNFTGSFGRFLPEVWSLRGITDANSAAKNENTATNDQLTQRIMAIMSFRKATRSEVAAGPPNA